MKVVSYIKQGINLGLIFVITAIVSLLADAVDSSALDFLSSSASADHPGGSGGGGGQDCSGTGTGGGNDAGSTDGQGDDSGDSGDAGEGCL